MTTKQFLRDIEDTFKTGLGIARRKNADYSKSTDPFANFRNVETLGICSVETGILTRITDKLARISNLVKQEARVKDETIEDTLIDLINYTAILKAYIKNKSSIN